MIMQERTGHYKRMATVHSTIDTKQPWGFEKAVSHSEQLHAKAKHGTRSKSRGSKRAHTSHGSRSKKLNAVSRGKNRSNSTIGMVRSGSGLSSSSPLVAGSFYSTADTALAANGKSKILDPFFDLLPQQREIYEQFVRMLAQLGNSEKCRILAHNAARDAEERQLLSDYTDVSNYFDSMLTKPAPPMNHSNGGGYAPSGHPSSAEMQSFSHHGSQSMIGESNIYPARSNSRLSDSLIRPSSRQTGRGRTRYGSGNYIPPDEVNDSRHLLDSIEQDTSSQQEIDTDESNNHITDDDTVDVFGNPLRGAPAGDSAENLKRSSVITANTDDALDFHLNGDGDDENDDFDSQSIEIRDEDLLEKAPEFDDQDAVFHSTS